MGPQGGVASDRINRRSATLIGTQTSLSPTDHTQVERSGDRARDPAGGVLQFAPGLAWILAFDGRDDSGASRGARRLTGFNRYAMGRVDGVLDR